MGQLNNISDLVASAREEMSSKIHDRNIDRELLWKSVERACRGHVRDDILYLLRPAVQVSTTIVQRRTKELSNCTHVMTLLRAALEASVASQLVEAMPEGLTSLLAEHGWRVNSQNGTLVKIDPST